MGLNTQMWSQRVPIQFISDDQPSLSITASQNALGNNPSSLKVVTGSNTKVDQDLLGIPHLRGDGESPPFSIQMEWKELGYQDYLNLCALRPYFVTFITFRNVGYYGKLVMDGPDSVMGSADIVHTTANFYPISPSDDGGAASIVRISDPSVFAVSGDGGAGSGGIPQNSDQYYFCTFSSEYGETNPQGPLHWNNGQDGVAINITWTWPATPHCQMATIYNCSNNHGDNPMLVAEIPSAFSPTWTDFVGYGGLTVVQALPTQSRAYKGSWNAGIWING